MTLYLVRHAKAVSESVDPERPLSEKGRAEAARVAAWLKAAGVSADRIWHSTKRRARETAAVMALSLGKGLRCEERKGFAPSDSAERAASEIGDEAEASAASSLMVVGHLPHLALLADYLMTGREQGGLLDFSECSVACLDTVGNGRWRLRWLLAPEMGSVRAAPAVSPEASPQVSPGERTR